MTADRGVRVYTVGFGTREGASIEFEGYSFYVRLDEETLKSIARMTAASTSTLAPQPTCARSTRR